MQGYKLNEGQYKKEKITVDEMWKSFDWLFSSYSRNDTSYKFLFLKSIIDSIDKKDSSGRISFDVLFEDYTRLAWNLVLKYNLSQKAEASDGRRTALENVLKDFCREYVPYEDLYAEDRKRICHKVKMACKKYVVGALYSDTNGLLYSFSKKNEWIELNPDMEKFVKENIGIIENLNYYKWACFYENINDKKKEVVLKESINTSMARKNESVYRSVLAAEFENTNINQNNRINSLELLMKAEQMENQMDCSDYDDVDSYLYKDLSSMKEYMNNPILLLKTIQKKKGLLM